MSFIFGRNKTINDVILITPQIFWDDRWFFMETYNKKDFEDAWIACKFVQDNHSKSKKWVFRWFHFQTQNPQAKLVRVIKWSVLDFVVDIRKDSPTYGKYIMIELNEKNKNQLFVPRWFAHGFLTLEDDTEFVYKCDNYYNPKFEWGIAWDDLDLKINWSEIMKKYDIKEIIVSEKDKNQTKLKNLVVNPF